MDDNFTEDEIQKVLTYLKHHNPENANRLFAIEMLRGFQRLSELLVDEDISQAELLRRALEDQKKKEEAEKNEEDDEETEDEDAESEESEGDAESEEPKTEESGKP